MIKIYSYSNFEELETIKTLLTLRNKSYTDFSTLGIFHTNNEDKLIEFYRNTFKKYCDNATDYLLVDSFTLPRILCDYIPIRIYSLSIYEKTYNEELPF